MYTAGKLNDNDLSLNVRHIYTIFMIYTILFMIHTV